MLGWNQKEVLSKAGWPGLVVRTFWKNCSDRHPQGEEGPPAGMSFYRPTHERVHGELGLTEPGVVEEHKVLWLQAWEAGVFISQLGCPRSLGLGWKYLASASFWFPDCTHIYLVYIRPFTADHLKFHLTTLFI